MNNEHRIFIYQDARGNITAREVTNISETEDYIQCICLKAEALRTFRKDRVLEFLDDNDQVDEKLEYHVANNPESTQRTRGASRRTNDTGRLEVCFTGFKKGDREKLIKLAESEELFIRSSVTKNLDFLCCGYNAGPAKIEKSRHQGVVVLSEIQFETMLETGEIPENA